MKLAIFDLDGTVLRGNSWRVHLRRTLLRRPARAPGLMVALALRAVGLINGRGLREAALGTLRGRDAEAVRAEGVELVAWQLRARIRPAARRELARCKAEGYELVLATGAFDFVARELAAELGIPHVVCTRLEFGPDGCCTGRIQDREARGDAKAEAVRTMFENKSVDWSSSCAFSDDMEDAPLFSLVGRAVFVGRPPAKTSISVEAVDWD